METAKLFGKYYKRLSRQSWVKSLICGLIVGCVAMLVTAFGLWLAGSKMFYLAFVSLAVGTATTPLFYKFVFKPTTKAVANKIDELGLEERMITMTELEGDESYIACRQREDAVKSLNSVSEGLLKLVVSVPMVIVLSISILLGGGMTAVAALSGAGVIDSGKDVIDDIKDEQVTRFTVEYDVEGDGVVEGEIVQSVEKGKNGTMVNAVALDGYAFYMWSDGLEDPVRSELKVNEDMKITAIFVELPEQEDGEGDGDGDGDGESQGDSEEPGDPKDGEGNSQGGSGDQDGGSGAGGGGNKDTDKFGNGEKDYKDYWEESKSDANEGMDGKDSGDQKIVDDYFNSIKSK